MKIKIKTKLLIMIMIMAMITIEYENAYGPFLQWQVNSHSAVNLQFLYRKPIVIAECELPNLNMAL